MSREYIYTNPIECWNKLAMVLSYGHTIPFENYNPWRKQNYILIDQKPFQWYSDESSDEYLLDDIQFALFEENIETIILCLNGLEHGPICDSWRFYFNKSGLFKASNYWNAD